MGSEQLDPIGLMLDLPQLKAIESHDAEYTAHAKKTRFESSSLWGAQGLVQLANF